VVEILGNDRKTHPLRCPQIDPVRRSGFIDVWPAFVSERLRGNLCRLCGWKISTSAAGSAVERWGEAESTGAEPGVQRESQEGIAGGPGG